MSLKKKILITGATGFIGSHLADYLSKRGGRIRCIVRKNSNLNWLKKINVECVYADLLNPLTLKKAVKNIDVIYHLAGLVRATNPSQLYKVNCKGTKNLVDSVMDLNLTKFVYVSSQAAWGPENAGPVSKYGRSKKISERYVKSLENYSIVRPVAVYGPRDKDFLPLFKMAKSGFFIQPRNCGKLNFTYVKDCVRGIVTSELDKESFLSDGKDYTWEDVKKTFEKTINRKILSVKLPCSLVRLSGCVGEVVGKLRGTPVSLNNDKVREMLAGNWVVPQTSFSGGVTLEEGFENTYKWYKENSWL